LKPIHFVGTSRADLQRLPESARETAGFQLFKIQQGQEPDDWKPLPMVGSGVQEVRISDKGNAYRVFVLAKFEEAVYVLHVFQKRSQKTAKSDVRLARSRYVDLMSWRKEQGDS
jgi:phage-related protein